MMIVPAISIPQIRHIRQTLRCRGLRSDSKGKRRTGRVCKWLNGVERTLGRELGWSAAQQKAGGCAAVPWPGVWRAVWGDEGPLSGGVVAVGDGCRGGERQKRAGGSVPDGANAPTRLGKELCPCVATASGWSCAGPRWWPPGRVAPRYVGPPGNQRWPPLCRPWSGRSLAGA